MGAEEVAAGGTEIPVPGVTALDHTADVGLEIAAPDGPGLFRRAAAGMMYLLFDRLPDLSEETRGLRISAPGPAALLREWLRELLYWHVVDGFAAAGIEVVILRGVEGRGSEEEEEPVLEARVRGASAEAPPVREIKGVTLHGLQVERRSGGLVGRVIFDV